MQPIAMAMRRRRFELFGNLERRRETENVGTVADMKG